MEFKSLKDEYHNKFSKYGINDIIQDTFEIDDDSFNKDHILYEDLKEIYINFGMLNYDIMDTNYESNNEREVAKYKLSNSQVLLMHKLAMLCIFSDELVKKIESKQHIIDLLNIHGDFKYTNKEAISYILFESVRLLQGKIKTPLLLESIIYILCNKNLKLSNIDKRKNTCKQEASKYDEACIKTHYDEYNRYKDIISFNLYNKLMKEKIIKIDK